MVGLGIWSEGGGGVLSFIGVWKVFILTEFLEGYIYTLDGNVRIPITDSISIPSFPGNARNLSIGVKHRITICRMFAICKFLISKVGVGCRDRRYHSE